MNWKVLALALLAASFIWKVILNIADRRSADNPTPENVKDVYDAEQYAKWRSYHFEKVRFSLISTAASFVLLFCLVLTDAFSAIVAGVTDTYSAAIFVLLLYELSTGILNVPFEWYGTMVIEQKYGFNRTTPGTFVADTIKGLVIGLGVTIGILCLFIAIHLWLGDGVIWLFAVALFAIVMFFSFLYPVFAKIFNKFTPLEDGELKTSLLGLMEKHGYKVRAIKVMDASRRTTKANAYFTGFGKMKTIVLYDTLLKTMTPEEICAVFAHEMGHGLHKDTLKNQIISLAQICIIAVLMWLTVRTVEIYGFFGFAAVNYGFAFVLLTEIELQILSPLMGLVSSAFSRRAEYRADRQAVDEGYADALISGLKKLNRDSLGNLSPSPLLVRLTYSHPTLSQRIDAIRAYQATKTVSA